jgi:N-acetylneuraminate synthase
MKDWYEQLLADRREVAIAGRKVGDGHPVFVIGEIGINHNGSLEIAKQLIDAAAAAGCDAVKFQKRTVDVVYTKEELARPRESPFGSTNGDLKRGLEFGADAYREIDRHCRERKILWFASPWDEASVDVLEAFDPPCYKVASASLTDRSLLRHIRSKGRPVLLSTGMSTMEEIEGAVRVIGEKDLVILHCTSTYPSEPGELNLRVMFKLRERFRVPVGYSGHEVGVLPTVIAAALGACVVERHITLDRAMWGTDQAASLEIPGLERVVRDIRLLSTILGDGVKRRYASEEPIRKKLRRVDSLSAKELE